MKNKTGFCISTLVILLMLINFNDSVAQTIIQTKKPLKIGIIRLTHTHVHWIFNRPYQGDITIVGIVEPNRELALTFAKKYNFSMDMVFNTMDELIQKTKPEAVTAFGSIFEHLGVVEKCAQLGIHVMVEKPLAVNMEHANKMKYLAEKHNIQLLTNYETTWYGSNKKAKQYINDENKIDEIRKMIFHIGHGGPIEIGCNPEFLEWLTDPVLNGAGVLTDFGCYGANISNWLLKGQKPTSVTCVVQHIKPNLYPKVEDECTILLDYPKTKVIIEASWNMPFNRKSTEIYGKTGYLMAEDRNNITYRWAKESDPTKEVISENKYPFDDPFAYFKGVIQKEIVPDKFDPSSLENNMMVVEILDAARESVKKGATVILGK